jgi:hypothetical protein
LATPSWGNKGKQAPGARPYHHQMRVVSLVERNAENRSFHARSVSPNTLGPILNAQITAKATLMTDDARVDKKIDEDFTARRMPKR